MREIKFMAYEKAYNVIREVVSINFADKTVVLKDDFFDDVKLLNFDDVNLMQYTGEKDKNSNEIYEGDIIKNTYGTQIPMVVTWDDAGFRTLGKHNGEQYVGYVKDSCEVIGNIYENPEYTCISFERKNYEDD